MRFVMNNHSKVFPYKLVSNEHLVLSGIISSPQGVDILVRVADTEKTRELGLSNFKSLPSDQGMLFVFPHPDTYGFWMKDMNFPIDIVWIDQNGIIIDRVINADPSSYPRTFIPKATALYVLEIPANSAGQYGLIIGTSVIIKK
jgi:uncharacterized membrane protein (UPF0127 family)